MYNLTVFILVFPYFLIQSVFVSLALTLILAISVIFLFTFYISVAKDLEFKKRFLEMSVISLGVAALTFLVGFLVRELFGVEV